MINNQKEHWNESYRKRDNFVFQPHEEIVRFVSKYIRKKVGLNKFEDKHALGTKPKVLDLGCGIGRHVFFLSQMGLDAHGIDLSETAVQFAREWTKKTGFELAEQKIVIADSSTLPWNDGFFHFVVSHGVLDSMHFDIAKKTVSETARILSKNGLFHCDLVSGDDSAHGREFSGEETVSTSHEFGTIQSYFNFSKIEKLIENKFEIVEAILIQRQEVLLGSQTARYHLTLKKL